MSLIDKSYFFNDYNIAQKDAAPVASKIQQYIDLYEAEYIEGALGEDFAALFNAGPAEPRWTALSDELKKKPSPIAGYVFWHYLRSEAIVGTGSGDAKMKSENATRAPESYRMRIGWNKMVEQTRKLHAFLKKNAATYPEFVLCQTNPDLISKQNDFGLL